MTTPVTALNECACGCGGLTKGTWMRGHARRGMAQKIGLLPGPDTADEDLDLGLLDVPPVKISDDPKMFEPTGGEFDTDDDEDEIPESPAPGHGGPGILPPRNGQRGRPAGHGKIRVTAAIRKDVEAKIRFVLVPAGQVWAARDPACGASFAYQEPEISASLAEIVCDSPDLLGWFTGPAGGFMKYFRLFMALQPVALTVYGHHIAHTIELVADDGRVPVDASRYAA